MRFATISPLATTAITRAIDARYVGGAAVLPGVII